MIINKKQWIMGPALVAMLASTMGITHAQPTAAGTNIEEAGKKGRGKGKRPAPMVTPQLLGKVLGQPLTADQKKAVAEAVKTYQESLAKAVGLTPEELDTKVKAYRQANKPNKPAA